LIGLILEVTGGLENQAGDLDFEDLISYLLSPEFPARLYAKGGFVSKTGPVNRQNRQPGLYRC
jgi:hypothetical protein